MLDRGQKLVPQSGGKWIDDELRIAVDAYIFMLQLEAAGNSISLKNFYAVLANGLLEVRNEASIRYRMRNISHVLSERRSPFLKAFSPASQVGSGVRKKIDSLLDERSDNLSLLQQYANVESQTPHTRLETLEKFDLLDEMFSSLNDEAEIGIGHNNPPQKIELGLADIKLAKDNIQKIKQQIKSDRLDQEEIELPRNNLVVLGLKLSIWTGSRITDFSKAAAIAAGTGIGIQVTELVPKILDALKSLEIYIHKLLNVI